MSEFPSEGIRGTYWKWLGVRFFEKKPSRKTLHPNTYYTHIYTHPARKYYQRNIFCTTFQFNMIIIAWKRQTLSISGWISASYNILNGILYITWSFWNSSKNNKFCETCFSGNDSDVSFCVCVGFQTRKSRIWNGFFFYFISNYLFFFGERSRWLNLVNLQKVTRFKLKLKLLLSSRRNLKWRLEFISKTIFNFWRNIRIIPAAKWSSLKFIVLICIRNCGNVVIR